MAAYNKVLVAVDIFGDYQTVMQKALAVTGKDAEISLVYVLEPLYYGDVLYGGSVEFEKQTLANAKKVFSKLGEEFGVPEDRRVVANGRPATEIHRQAEKLEVDLIVLGTHGRHGLQLMLGSTANAVLHGVKCDVLAVRVLGETIDAD